MLLVLAAMAVIAGCGSDDSLSSRDIARAADKTAAKGGSRIAIDQTITVPGEPPLQMSGTGVVDTKSKRGRLEFTGAGISQQVAFEGFTIYMRSSAFSGRLPGGKSWLKIDINEAGKAAGIDLGALSQQGQDPTQALRYLKAASGGVKRVGEEDVRGDKTTHYTATVDLNRYPAIVPASDREAARRTISQIVKLAGTDKLPMEVWIGADDVVRRLKQTIRTQITSTTRGTIDQRIDFFDFGAPVDVSLPPADEVQDATDLAAEGVRRLNK